MRRSLLALLVAANAAPSLFAQSPKSELDPSHWGVVYDVPATRSVVVKQDLVYANIGEHSLKLDLFQPPRLKSGEKRAAVVFLNAIGGVGRDTPRRWAIYQTWPRLVAAHGMIGISMDTEDGKAQESLTALFQFLRREGARYGVDPDRLGVYAASANVSGAHTYLTGQSVDRGIKAAALYYGGVPDGAIRPDLPVLFVVAQSDVPRMGAALPALWQRVVDSALPWTLTFGRGMPHGFDGFSDTDDARQLIRQTLAFWQSHLEPMPARTEPPAEGRAIVASLYAHDQTRAVDLLSRWVRTHPTDAVGFAQYGTALTDLNRPAAADSAWAHAFQLDSTEPGIVDGLARLRINQNRWDEAERLYLKLVDLGHDNSQVQGQIGWTRLHLGKNAEAVTNYERALELGVPPGRFRALAYYNLACGYARLGRKDEAITALGRAVEQGMKDRATFEQDDDLRPLRDDPRFQQLLGRLT
jgi:Flp pilus assembly protein TadD